MPLDPARVEDTRAWLIKAAADLRAVQVDLDAAPPLLEDSVFHCQQAAEKCLKAFLAWHDRPLRKTHNLEEIGKVCLEVDPSLQSLVGRVVPLSEYAWRFRYPGESAGPSQAEALDAFSLAREVHDAILARLPAQVRP